MAVRVQRFGVVEGRMRFLRFVPVVLVSISLVLFQSELSVAETILTMPNQYLVQRFNTGVAALEPASYALVKSHRNFDLVVPSSAVRRVGASSTRPEVLDWAKVRRDCDEIMKDPSVRSCDPNLVRKLTALPNDPSFSSQWALAESSSGADIDVQAAWNFGVGSATTLVGVIDSGVATNHPDLMDNLWSNPAEVIDGVDNDGNGYIDDISGANTALGTANISDCDGHGTHVSGIIGARGDNSIGVSGLNWVTAMIVARTDADCTGAATMQAVIQAYDYLTDLKQRGYNIKVVNASFGGSGFVQAEFDAVERMSGAGILLVAAAGNEGTNVDAAPFYPASLMLPNVVSVSATGPEATLADYSNYGPVSVHIAAPGGDFNYSNGGILSTWATAATPSTLYHEIQGTSMATPMVTGALALIASQRTELSALQLRQLLLNSALTLSQLEASVQGGRFLNIGAMASGATPQDECPSDDFKFSPGICGCGVQDRDQNGNSRADCLDPVVRDLIPQRPRVKVSGKRVIITMQSMTGVEWYVEVVNSRRARSGRVSAPKSRIYVSQSPKGWVPKPAKGTALKVRYAFRVAGTKSDFSFWSAYRNLGPVS
jgi:subtilisin family serine protease